MKPHTRLLIYGVDEFEAYNAGLAVQATRAHDLFWRTARSRKSTGTTEQARLTACEYAA